MLNHMDQLLKKSSTLFIKTPFQLECGQTLSELEIAYHLFGENGIGTKPIVWVCHALTANSNVEDWWPGLFGPGCLFNAHDYTIVCANILGSCYGSTSALSHCSRLGRPYFSDFPLISVRDMVNAHELLRKNLGIEKIHIGIGGSLGGQQLLEWTVLKPELFDVIVPIATNAQHSPWGKAFNESQRLALQADSSFGEHHADAGAAGLVAARAIGMLSYRSYEAYKQTQEEKNAELLDGFLAASYQCYQGEKLRKRFNAYAYWTLTKAMDSHHLGRLRGSLEEVLQSIETQCLSIGVKGDVLFPPEEQQFIARHISGAKYTGRSTRCMATMVSLSKPKN
jgi:homoserine O-acetyltransferase/O-succinyltransferase